tara:strand:- start:690 stop:1286 length:597 start_codon:yes stop_codon:yes gene_type:complete
MKKVKLKKISSTNQFQISITQLLKDEFSKINKKFDKMENQIQSNEKKIMDLANKMNLLIDSINDNCKQVKNMRDLSEERIILDKEDILHSLKLHNLTGDIRIIKKFYLDIDVLEEPSIRQISSRKFEYWNNGRWNDDFNCVYIVDTLTKNLQTLYTSVNFLTNVNNNTNIFMTNQKHINNLTTEKYRKLLVREIKKIL